MVLLYLRLLAGPHRITEEQMQFLVSLRVIFKGEDIREFTSIIREDDRDQGGRRETFSAKLVFQSRELICCFSGGLVVQ